jgi:hypothetical protein
MLPQINFNSICLFWNIRNGYLCPDMASLDVAALRRRSGPRIGAQEVGGINLFDG